MANSYVQFSAELINLSDEEAEWLKAELRGPVFDFEDGDDDDKKRELCIAWAKEHGVDVDDGDPVDFFGCWPRFDWSINRVDILEHLWIRDDEGSGDIESVVSIVRRFLRKFKRKDAFVLEWAETCSKPRIGEFGGGGVVVTAKETKWFVPSDMIRKYLDKRGKRGKR